MVDILYKNEKPFRKIINSMRFSSLRISLTKDCNANCFFCHNEGQVGGKKRVDEKVRLTDTDLNRYEYIANFFRKDMKKVLFTGGEPTLVENLPEIVSTFHNKGYKTKITTNAFYLDRNLQEKLKKSGLDGINISMPSLDEKEYNKSFGVTNKLNTVLKNISYLKETFPNRAKINFMVIEDDNLEKRILDFAKFGTENEIKISFLTLLKHKEDNIADKVINVLAKNIGLENKSVEESRFGNKYIYRFKNGSIWEFDDFRDKEYKREAFENEYCKKCEKVDRCVEGPYALRISADGEMKPCLIRDDNVKYTTLELKFPSKKNIAELIEKSGFVKEKDEHQVDTYYIFNEPIGGIRTWLRLRENETTGENSFDLHQLLSTNFKEKEEVNIESRYVDKLKKMMMGIGHKPKYIVDKKRELYMKDDILFRLDNIKGLGNFVEIEIVGRANRENIDRLNNLATGFGFDLDEQINAGYPELVKEKVDKLNSIINGLQKT